MNDHKVMSKRRKILRQNGVHSTVEDVKAYLVDHMALYSKHAASIDKCFRADLMPAAAVSEWFRREMPTSAHTNIASNSVFVKVQDWNLYCNPIRYQRRLLKRRRDAYVDYLHYNHIRPGQIIRGVSGVYFTAAFDPFNKYKLELIRQDDGTPVDVYGKFGDGVYLKFEDLDTGAFNRAFIQRFVDDRRREICQMIRSVSVSCRFANIIAGYAEEPGGLFMGFSE